jgi:predicted O-methyltransferase YrrM
MLEQLHQMIRIAERFPRDYDPNHRALLQNLRAHASRGDPGLEDFGRIWSDFCRDILSSPLWLDLLFPERCSEDPTLLDRARKAGNARYLPGNGMKSVREFEQWADVQADPGNATGLLSEVLAELETAHPATGTPFRFLSKFYFFRDISYGYFVDPKLRAVQEAIFHQCHLQRRNWKLSYASDYPYQGMARLGISGAKPTEERLARYDISAFLRPTDRVLDIGANNGCFALTLSEHVAHVDAIEYNPFLIAAAHIAAEHLEVRNVSFMVGDFVEFVPTTRYDAVFSLANHCTIDGNLSMDFEEYIAKCFAMIATNGYLFFESHNVFAPGKGAAGDDGDLDAKFDIVERYFEVVKFKMTPCYVPAFDIDKLFVVLRRRATYRGDAVRTFNLSEARLRYAY